MRKKTMKGAADLQKRMDNYEKKPFYKKKYVMNRTNSLAEMKRIYVWLTGTKKGVYEFEARLKEEFPGAKRMRGNGIYHRNNPILPKRMRLLFFRCHSRRQTLTAKSNT
jgi:hypothetical protein